MIIWLDAHLAPALAPWIADNLENIEAYSVRWLGLRDARDHEIWEAARQAEVVVMTKDQDFERMLKLHGAPPKVLWITCGNTSNARMREILLLTLAEAVQLLEAGEDLIEIGDAL